jgi:hypothetical protein
MLVEAYPRDVHEGTLEAYALHLASLDRGEAVQAVMELVSTNKWLPTIAEVKQAVARRSLPASLPVATAWAQAVGLMSGIGSYGMLDNHGNPYVNRTLRLCGRWADICQEDATWLRKRFVEIYTGVVEDAERTLQIGQDAPDWLRLDGPAELRKLLAKIGEPIP